MSVKRMFIEGEFTAPESERMAAQRLMMHLDEEAAKNGMAVTGDVEVAASETGLFNVPRVMRLEADVVPR